jgi:integrase
MALRWEDADLEARRIRVARSWDPKEGVVVAPKSAAGARSVPMLAVLRTHLLEHRLSSGRGDGLVFGADGTAPFGYSSAVARARRAWREAGLAPIGLHECRHTFAALLIAAGVNPKALSSFMGHASIGITLDRYGHLFPGSEDEAAELADAYLERVDPEALARPLPW